MRNPFLKKEIAGSYDEFYITPIGKLYDKIEKESISKLLKDVDSISDKSLLEIGSGTGHWCEYFASLGFEVIGLEISDEMLKIAREKEINNVDFIKGDAEKFDLESKFDVIAFITSLEFMDNPKIVIENAISHLNSQGVIIIGVLNDDSVLGRSRKAAKEETPYTHAHFYTKLELEALFSQYGKPKFDFCSIDGDNFFITGRVDIKYEP